jgi:hypothetical protein
MFQKFAIARTRSLPGVGAARRSRPISLRAFFECGGFTSQMRQDFAGEMQ